MLNIEHLDSLSKSIEKCIQNYDFEKMAEIQSQSLLKIINSLNRIDYSSIFQNCNIILQSFSEKLCKIYDIYDTSFVEKAYNNILKTINFDELRINEDGEIKYKDETVTIEEEDVGNIVSTLEEIKGDISQIKEQQKKPIVFYVIIVFIIQMIVGGFFNKMGETIYDTIGSSFNSFKTDNDVLDNNQNPKDLFINLYRIVIAQELNLRMEPSSNSQLIGKLYKNQCVKVIEKKKIGQKLNIIVRKMIFQLRDGCIVDI